MRTTNKGLVIEMSKEELLRITTEVKEVLAIGHISNNQSTFGSIDLWNIQRRRKTMMSRRNYA